MAASKPFVSLSKRVVRIVGGAAGPFTLNGTNTYLVGTGKRRWLIDPGDGTAGHVEAVRNAMQKSGAETIGGILLTHWHRDHSNSVPECLRVFGQSVPVHKVEGRYLPWLTYRNIKDREVILVDDETALQAIHTPGHATDHACFSLLQEDTLFTGDALLAGDDAHLRGPVEDLPAHLKSLARMALLQPRILLPGHGDAVLTSGTELVKQRIAEAEDRSRRIVAILEGAVSTSGLTAQQITDRLLKGTSANSDAALRESAHGLVLQHLLQLEAANRIVRLGEATTGSSNSGSGSNSSSKGYSGGGLDPSMKGPGGMTMTQVHELLQRSNAKDRQFKDAHRAPPTTGASSPPPPPPFNDLDAVHAHLAPLKLFRWRLR